MAYVQPRPSSSAGGLLGLIGGLALAVAVYFVGFSLFHEAIAPEPWTPEKAAQAEATSRAVSMMNSIDFQMENGRRYIQDAVGERNTGDEDGYRSRLRAAIKDFTWVIDHKPDYAPAYYERALASVALGETEDAQHDLQRVLELSPDEELRRKAEDTLQELAEK